MDHLRFDKHIFVCTNQRGEGTRVSCGEHHGMALVTALKKAIKDSNLPIEVRAQKAGCLDICEQGPNVVIYPDGIFYGNVQLTDVSEIVESHLKNNLVVERLKLSFDRKKNG